MSLEIGPTHNLPQTTVPAVRGAEGNAFAATLAAATPVDSVQVGVPPTVLDEVGAAADRADQLAAEQRELHFERDRTTGRVVVQVRDLRTGDVIRTIPPSKALDVLSGGEL